MALQKLTRDLLFGGLDTKTARQLVPEGASLTMQDAEFDRPEAVNKRNGYTALPTSSLIYNGAGSITAGVALLPFGNTPLLADGARLYRLASQSGGGKVWAGVGVLGLNTSAATVPPGAVLQPDAAVMPVRITTSAAGGPAQVVTSDYVAVGNVALVVGLALSGVPGDPPVLLYSVVDTASWSVLASASMTMAASWSSVKFAPRVVTDGTILAMVYPDPTTGTTIRVHYWDPTAVSSQIINPSFDGVVATDWDQKCAYDVAYIPPLGGMVLAYTSAATPPNSNVKLQKFSIFGASGAATTIALNVAAASPVHIPAVCASGRFVVAFNGTLYMRETTFAAVNSTPYSRADGLPGIPAGAGVGYEYATDSVRYVSSHATFPVSQSTGGRFCTITPSTGGYEAKNFYFMIVSSRAFSYAGIPVAWFRYFFSTDGISDTQPTYCLMRLDHAVTDSTGTDLAILATSRAGDAAPISLWYPNIGAVLPASVSAYTTVLQATKRGANSEVVPSVVRLDPLAPMRSAVLDGICTVTGLQAYETEGSSLWPSGFSLGPDLVSASAGAGAIPAGTYQIVLVSAGYNDNGDVTYSPPTSPTPITLGAPGGISLTVQPSRYGRYGLVEAYLSIDGVNFYYAGAVAPSPFSSQVFLTLTTFSTASRQLYTAGGVLPTRAPPCLVDVISRGRRLYGVTPEGEIIYTREKVVGESPPWAPDFCTKQLIDDPGQHWRLADMDGRLFALGENGLQWLAGEGLNNTGTSDNLSAPQLVPNEGGIVRYSPALPFGDGIAIKQRQGLHVLTRSLGVESFGLPVDAYSALVTVSAVSVQHKHQLRFGHSNGPTLVYDLIKRQWSTFSNHIQVDATYVNGAYYVLHANGVVWRQDDTVWTDAGAAVGRVIETPWVHPSALLGVQRLWWFQLLGEWQSSISLQVQVFYDYGQTAAETVTFAQATGTPGDPLQFRHHCGRRCESFKFIITDTSAGQGSSLSGIGLEFGVRGGKLAPLGSAQSE